MSRIKKNMIFRHDSQHKLADLDKSRIARQQLARMMNGEQRQRFHLWPNSFVRRQRAYRMDLQWQLLKTKYVCIQTKMKKILQHMLTLQEFQSPPPRLVPLYIVRTNGRLFYLLAPFADENGATSRWAICIEFHSK